MRKRRRRRRRGKVLSRGKEDGNMDDALSSVTRHRISAIEGTENESTVLGHVTQMVLSGHK